MTNPAPLPIFIDGGSAFSTYQDTETGGDSGGQPVLAPYQLSYNGLLFGAQTDAEITKLSGLREMPATRSGDVNRPRRGGTQAGRTLFGERIVQIDLLVQKPQSPFEAVLQSMSDAFRNIEDPDLLLPLRFLLPGWHSPRQVFGRPTKGGYPVDVNYQFQRVSSSVQITCPDPLIYDTTTQSVSAVLAAPTAGLTFPVAFDVTFGQSTGGLLPLANIGNEALRPVFTFTGPLTWPQLLWGDKFLAFEVTLAAGDRLVVDCDQRTALLNGASRTNKIVTGSTWLEVPPGGLSATFASVDSVAVTGAVTSTLPLGAWGWA